jgi:catalase
MAFSTSGEVVDSYGVVTASEVSPQSFKEVVEMARGAKDFVDAYTFAISQHKNFERETEGLNAMVAY